MNAEAFRQFYEYHFGENRKLWDLCIVPLTQDDFMQPVDYSVGSVRNQMVHMMSCDDYWFSGLRGLPMPDMLDPTPFEDREEVRAHWDAIEDTMRAYLADLRDETLFEHPFTEGDDRNLTVWNVLLQVVNHGTDHRAQVLKLLNELGVETGAQDYIFYLFDHM